MLHYITHAAAETEALAERLGMLLPDGSLLILSGELGAGKTVFAKGLARGLGIKERVTSPTFLLAQEYEGGRLPFYHLDAYRLENCAVDGLGLEDYWSRGGVCLIEWGELLAGILPPDYTHISIAYCGENERRITITGGHERLISSIAADLALSYRITEE